MKITNDFEPAKDQQRRVDRYAVHKIDKQNDEPKFLTFAQKHKEQAKKRHWRLLGQGIIAVAVVGVSAMLISIGIDRQSMADRQMQAKRQATDSATSRILDHDHAVHIAKEKDDGTKDKQTKPKKKKADKIDMAKHEKLMRDVVKKQVAKDEKQRKDLQEQLDHLKQRQSNSTSVNDRLDKMRSNYDSKIAALQARLARLQKQNGHNVHSQSQNSGNNSQNGATNDGGDNK